VIGATGGIGSICSRLLAQYCGEVVLVARNRTRLDKLRAIIKEESGKSADVCTDITKAIQNADILFFSTNDPNCLIKSTDIKGGAIICDMSIPKNVSKEIVDSRKDILVIDGGIVRPPGDAKFNFYFGPPPGLAYACIAETMILTLEQKFESFSLGDNISMDKVVEIRNLGQKHGFTIAEFRSFYSKITAERIKTTKKAIKNRTSTANIAYS
ncbi:MAG: shikimate dehydrogenase, partial [Candidatus Omnitrophica bacterium]|nr:shikimate dehydrogenase [Candidatus Omnitrophota bacterium]